MGIDTAVQAKPSPTPAVRRAGWGGWVDAVLFACLLAVEIVPIWWFTYFPSQDGPAHLENAAILREYHDPARAMLREFYTINTQPEPNWLGHLLLAGLMAIVPALVAEKILLIGYLILLPLAARYAVGAVRADAGFLALLIFPFVPNLFFHMGFYNFCYSLPLFFFVVAYWLKRQDGLSIRQIVVLGGLGLLLYFGHLVSLCAAWAVIGIQILWLTYLDTKRQSATDRIRIAQIARLLWSRMAGPFWAFLPALGLALWFLSRQGWAARPMEDAGGNRLAILIKLEALVSYSVLEGLPALALAVFFAALTVYFLRAWLKGGRATSSDGLLLAAVVFVNLCLLMPAALSGGLFVNFRLTLYPFFTLLLWFAAQPGVARARWPARAAALATTLAFVLLHVSVYARANDYLDELLTVGEAIEPDHTLLPLSFTSPGLAPDGVYLSSRVALFRHIDGHIARQRHLVNLKNYEATTGYFPILYRPELNPYPIIGLDDKVLDRGLHSVPPRVDLLRYEQTTGRPMDYVLIWGVRSAPPDDPASKALAAQLKAGRYEEVPLRSPRHLAHLYRRCRCD